MNSPRYSHLTVESERVTVRVLSPPPSTRSQSGFTLLTTGERRRVYNDGECPIAILGLNTSVPREKDGCTWRMLLPLRRHEKTHSGRIQALRYLYTSEADRETWSQWVRPRARSRVLDHTVEVVSWIVWPWKSVLSPLLFRREMLPFPPSRDNDRVSSSF